MTQQPEVLPPEVQRVPTAVAALQDLDNVLARANAVIQVTNAKEYEIAVVVCGQIKRALEDQEKERLAITRPMDQAKDRIMALFQRASGPLKSVDTLIRGKLKAYNDQQRLLADQQRRKAEAEAERERQDKIRKAREEQERADREAKAKREEAERQRQEAARLAETARAQRQAGDEAAAKATAKQAAQLATAAMRTESKADVVQNLAADKAQELLAQAATIVAPIVQNESPKVAGSIRKKNWKHRVVDPSKVDRRFLMLDEVKIGKTVRSLGKDAEDLIGGIVVEEDHSIGIKAAK